MASLTEVYEGGNNGAGRRQLYAGVALFTVGAVLLVAGIVVAATGVGSRFGLDLYDARGVAGILGGVGLPRMPATPRASYRPRPNRLPTPVAATTMPATRRTAPMANSAMPA